MSPLSVLFVMVGVAGAVDAARRPASDWIALDRKKGNWIVAMLLLNVFAVMFYVCLVVPKFTRATSTDTEFLKRPS
jgi:hypothetical protein